MSCDGKPGASRRAVSDAEVRERMADSDVSDLIACETKKYRLVLDEHQRESAASTALWRAIQYHRDALGNKFTTSLYKFLHWELRRELKKERRRVGHGLVARVDGDIHDLPELLTPPDLVRDPLGGCREDPEVRDTRERARDVVECMEKFLPRNVRTALRMYYWDNRTVEEIGELNGYSKETARQYVDLGVRRLKEICGAEDD